VFSRRRGQGRTVECHGEKVVFVVDTNIFLYAAIEEFPLHKKARALLEGWRNSPTPWHSTWTVFYEFLRVSTHSSVFRRPLESRQSWKFLSAIFEAPTFSLLTEGESHSLSLPSLIAETNSISGNLWHDAHIALVMRENGIRTIYTADTDFYRFKHIKVINPL